MPAEQTLTAQHRRRILDSQIKKRSDIIYQDILSIFMEDAPAAHASVFQSLIDKEYITCMQLADSFTRVDTTCASSTYEASQLAALIKKYPFPAHELKPLARSKAVDKFWHAERRCRRYNLRFRRLNSGGYTPMQPILSRMRSWIRYVLGDEPDMRQIYGLCDFGPGASIGVGGDSTNIARKLLSEKWSVTPLALPYAATAFAYNPLFWELLFPDQTFVCYDVDAFSESFRNRVEQIHHNKVTFVPKTTLVDRTIAVEPLLNGYLQKGIDQYMRLLLKRVNIDLSDQTRNQKFAYLGSIPDAFDPFCTIDLSSASDSVCTELVRFLLPPAWFDLLNRTRAGVGRIDDNEFLYEKFVSMGNGFCFPLETLIFASACSVFSDVNDFTVYGDDIIVRKSSFADVIKTLRYLGFRENHDKTFSSGLFRESCGADWYSGVNVRPLTLDYKFDSVESVIKFYNMSTREPLWHARFEKVRKYLFELIPRRDRLVRPYIGDPSTAFEVDLDTFMASPFSRWNRKLFCWDWFETIRRPAPDRGIRHHRQYHTALMVGALRGSSSECPFAIRRKTVLSFRRVSHSGAISLWTPGQETHRRQESRLETFQTWHLRKTEG